MMHEHGKSDGPVVPAKPSNKAEQPAAERVEGSGPAKGNSTWQTTLRTQSREGVQQALGRVRQVAMTDKKMRFTVLRQTMRKRLQAKLAEVKVELQRRMHDPVPEVGRWLGSVVEGHCRYYGVPMNSPALGRFRFQVGWLWQRALSRRSQRGGVTWDRMARLIARHIPPARIHHPYPLHRLGVITQGKSRMR